MDNMHPSLLRNRYLVYMGHQRYKHCHYDKTDTLELKKMES